MTPNQAADTGDERNPHSQADLQHASDEIAYQLRHQKEVELTGEETSDELADLLTAVETFESAVSALGGDNMVNRLTSKDPENSAFVLPKRSADESARAYIERVEEATQGIRGL